MMSAVLLHSIVWTFEQSKEARVTSLTSISADIVASSRWLDRENELKAIRRYRDDWDGMGATAPNPHIVDNAIRFLRKLNREGEMGAPDSVGASPTGAL